MMKLLLAPVEPTDVRTTTALVHRGDRSGCRLERVEVSAYPLPSYDLRVARRALGFTLREAARRMCLSTSQVSGLERGSLAPSAPTTWDDVLEALNGARR